MHLIYLRYILDPCTKLIGGEGGGGSIKMLSRKLPMSMFRCKKRDISNFFTLLTNLFVDLNKAFTCTETNILSICISEPASGKDLLQLVLHCTEQEDHVPDPAVPC